MRITVVVPTYRRPRDLGRCLEGLRKQSRPADEIVLVAREGDIETLEFLRQHDFGGLPVTVVEVRVPGSVAAMNRGLESAGGDVIAFMDDDAVPRPDWLERIEAHFESEPELGGVGGRDWMHVDGGAMEGSEEVVGKLQWFGRRIGNHHLGVGEPREVDILKGVNMSFRRKAITGLKFDERLLGGGAQVHSEVGFCLAIKKAGWKLIYDPAVAVDHYLGERFDEDKRVGFNALANYNTSHNEALSILEYLTPAGRLAYIIWFTLVGTRTAPGILLALALLPTEGVLAFRKLKATLGGRLAGWVRW